MSTSMLANKTRYGGGLDRLKTDQVVWQYEIKPVKGATIQYGQLIERLQILTPDAV